MSNDRSREQDNPQRIQRTRRRPTQPESAEHSAAPETKTVYPHSLLSDSLLSARGNEPVRTAVIQQMQQTYGNRAVQRFLQRRIATTTPEQGAEARPVQATRAETLAVQRDDKTQKAIDRVTAAATLTAGERASLPTLPAALKTEGERLKVVKDRLKELKKQAAALKKTGKTLGPDEAKEQTDLKKEQSELEAKIEAGKTAMAKSQMEDDFKAAGTTTKDWFKNFKPGATFLGLPISPSGGASSGVHKELADHLEKAEKQLEKDLGCTGKDCATKLGVYSISGLRPPKSATGATRPSMHCYGLAVDVNYKGNPFIGNESSQASVKVIENATLLVTGDKVTATEAPGTKGVSQMWDRLHGASESLKSYFSLLDDADKLAARVGELNKKGDKRDVAAWTVQIKEDYKAVWNKKAGEGEGDFAGHNDPSKEGMMDLDKRLVEALVNVGGLTWGGQYTSGKDIMHFDWRGGTIKH